MARLDHANIVRVNRVEDHPQLPFFEMEYVEGQTLADYRGARALSLQEAMPLLKQMAAALDAAHKQKIIHRDVKPANILLDDDGNTYLTDFGIALDVEVDAPHPTMHSGSPEYAAPEQLRREAVTPTADVYGLAISVYQALTE